MMIPSSQPCQGTFCRVKHKRDPAYELIKQAKKYSPTLVKGYNVGNRTVVDKKSWLEVCDQKHRYGANLRVYYKEWKRLPNPKVDFWKWLDDDSIEAAGVPRQKLETETVLYCATNAERIQFALDIENGRLIHHSTKTLVNTDEEGWIFVLQDGVLYANKKETESTPRIHHTSFVAGECVQAAGMLVIRQGQLQIIYPHSGHYRPSDNELRVLLEFLQSCGVALNQVNVDMQRIQKVARCTNAQGTRVKKFCSRISGKQIWC